MTVNVDAVVYFRVYDPIKSVKNVENAQFSTRLLAATTLRNTLGNRKQNMFSKDLTIIDASRHKDITRDITRP